MLTLHHLENSQSFRIVWLLEELNADYELKRYARDARTSLAPAAYKALHPAGTAPVISDGDMTLAETNAIVDYILDKYPDSLLRPTNSSTKRTNYLYWFHSALGSVTPMLLILYIFSMMTEKSPWFIRPIIAKITNVAANILPRPRINSALKHMNEVLAENNYLAGSVFTVADIVMAYNLQAIEKRMKYANFSSDYPHIASYLQRLQAREAYQRAVDKVDE